MNPSWCSLFFWHDEVNHIFCIRTDADFELTFIYRLKKESWRRFGGKFATSSLLRTVAGGGRSTSTDWRAGTLHDLLPKYSLTRLKRGCYWGMKLVRTRGPVFLQETDSVQMINDSSHTVTWQTFVSRLFFHTLLHKLTHCICWDTGDSNTYTSVCVCVGVLTGLQRAQHRTRSCRGRWSSWRNGTCTNNHIYY